MLRERQPRENPFPFGKVVTGKYFVDRKEERREIAAEIEQHTNIILYSPRRYGKTSLVHQTFLDLKRKHKNFCGLVIDFYAVTSKEKFLKLLAREYGRHSGLSIEKLLQHLRSILSGIVPSISVDAMGNPRLDIQFTPGQTSLAFEQIVNLPSELAKRGKLVAVFFDEFQEINILDGKNFQRELRSVIQHHQNVSYIFSGSKYHLFQAIFEQPSSPLYRMGKRLSLGRVPAEEYVPFLTKHLRVVSPKFTREDALRLYQEAAGVPYYVQMLAHEVFNLALLKPETSPDDLLNEAIQKVVENKQEEFSFIVENLNPSERMAIEILIHQRGNSLFSKQVQREFGIAPSTLRKSLVTLQQKGIILQEGRQYRFQDVFFERWLQEKL